MISYNLQYQSVWVQIDTPPQAVDGQIGKKDDWLVDLNYLTNILYCSLYLLSLFCILSTIYDFDLSSNFSTLPLHDSNI